MEWSQDGTKLLVSGPVAQEKQGIWMISVIGATLKKLRDDAQGASLSPDGSQIVYRDAITREVGVMSADGGQARVLFKPEEGYRLFAPTWFQDGQRVAYVKYRAANGGTTLTIESRDLKGGDPVPLVSNSRLTDFCWGGRQRLIYTVREAPPNQYDSNLWEVRFDEKTGKPTSTPRRLTDWTGFTFGNPELTADGKRFVFLNGRQQSDVYIAELAAGGAELKAPQRLTLDDRIDWPGGWSKDSKTLFLYSDLNGDFDIYKQGIGERNSVPMVTGREEKWGPQLSPDGKWVVYIQGARTVQGGPSGSLRLMRVPLAGGPAEAVMDVTGSPDILSGGDPTLSVGGFPSFRCPSQTSTTCVLAEADESQVRFTAFDVAQGRKGELVKVSTEPDFASWDLSPDGSKVVVSKFDYKAGDLKIVSLADKAITTRSAMPWTELAVVAWAADGKSVFLGSYSSRGTTIVSMDPAGKVRKLFTQPSWDIFSLVPSPDGHYLAFGPIVANANAWTIASFPQK
jgi:Tol biopolymer transport system component